MNGHEMLKAFDVEKIIRLIKFLLLEMFLRFRIERQSNEGDGKKEKMTRGSKMLNRWTSNGQKVGADVIDNLKS